MAPYSKEPLTKAQIIAQSYYARKDIQKEMYEFCKGRETVANFNNKFFAKRPDCFDYPNDIGNAAKQGATSFHCSEEIWTDPLQINTDMTPTQYNEIRAGWDFLIDIDAKYFDYAKIAAHTLLKTLEEHGAKNVGIKFSGSKGFHIIIPFKSFPEEMREEKTKNHFPEWARYIAGYLKELTIEKITQQIIRISNREELTKKGELTSQNICPLCKGEAKEKKISKYKCPNFRCKAEVTSMKSKKKSILCPSCNGNMEKVGEETIIYCENCKVNTAKIKETSSNIGGETRESNMQFSKKEVAKSAEDSIDIILVSSRHLFRAPYSLHEKTAFASIVLEKEEIEDFLPHHADPLRIEKTKPFMPEVEPGEAKELLQQALEWAKKQNIDTPKEKKYEGPSIDLKEYTITEDMYPPIIKKLLKGVPNDGRKRALSLLLSYFSSLEFPQDFIEEKIEEWNNKNYHPLKQGYIRSQILWHIKNKRMPPNYDKPIYKEFGITPEPGIKNPLNYTIRRAMKAKAVQEQVTKKENKHL